MRLHQILDYQNGEASPNLKGEPKSRAVIDFLTFCFNNIYAEIILWGIYTLVMDRLVLCIPMHIFQRESWLLAPVRFDKSCCLNTLPSTSHEECPNAGVGCPGDMVIPIKLHLFPFLSPRPGAPLQTGVTGFPRVSPAQEATVLGMLIIPLRQRGQLARGPG